MGIIRVLLALSVVLGHLESGFRMISPPLAVESFFIISGFYMSLILNEKYINANNSYKLFITNRLLKLYPIYVVVLLLMIVTGGVIYAVTGQLDKTTALSYFINYYPQMGPFSFIFLAFVNIFIFFQDVVMFLGLNVHTGNLFFTADFKTTNPGLYNFLFIPQAWSIGLELMFYLIAPFVVRRNLKIISVLILISLSIRIYLVRHGLTEDPWNYRFFPNELLFFLLGNVAYKAYVKMKPMSINKWIPIGAFVAVVAFTVLYSFIPGHIKHYFYTLLFFVALPFIFQLTKKSKSDLFIGEFSYPIYICHLFVAWSVNKILSGQGKETTNLIIIALVFVVSFLLNKLVIKKIERFRQNRISNASKQDKFYKSVVTK
jgi:peptidoglycan/LPS O-acetylase OafA/YrhL